MLIDDSRNKARRNRARVGSTTLRLPINVLHAERKDRWPFVGLVWTSENCPD